jgi:hypothetical protein
MLLWTSHAKAKMHFYKLSEGRVRRVLQTPRRVEEGVAPDTIALMQPTSFRTVRKEVVPAKAGTRASSCDSRMFKEVWSQEIWVMVQDDERGRKVISAWRYPGMSKVRSVVALQMAREEYDEFIKEK